MQHRVGHLNDTMTFGEFNTVMRQASLTKISETSEKRKNGRVRVKIYELEKANKTVKKPAIKRSERSNYLDFKAQIKAQDEQLRQIKAQDEQFRQSKREEKSRANEKKAKRTEPKSEDKPDEKPKKVAKKVRIMEVADEQPVNRQRQLKQPIEDEEPRFEPSDLPPIPAKKIQKSIIQKPIIQKPIIQKPIIQKPVVQKPVEQSPPQEFPGVPTQEYRAPRKRSEDYSLLKKVIYGSGVKIPGRVPIITFSQSPRCTHYIETHPLHRLAENDT